MQILILCDLISHINNDPIHSLDQDYNIFTPNPFLFIRTTDPALILITTKSASAVISTTPPASNNRLSGSSPESREFLHHVRNKMDGHLLFLPQFFYRTTGDNPDELFTLDIAAIRFMELQRPIRSANHCLIMKISGEKKGKDKVIIGRLHGRQRWSKSEETVRGKSGYSFLFTQMAECVEVCV